MREVRGNLERGGGGVGLGVWSRHIVTTCILPRDFERITRNKGVTGASQGVTFERLEGKGPDEG